jgi:arginine/lysine/ornithine decarboxylase
MHVVDTANFVIPYPPGFPIMVPGQVITEETITFMRKLDVKDEWRTAMSAVVLQRS